MKHEFTKQEILSNRGCYERNEVENLSFINNEPISLIDIVKSEIPLKDKFWFVIRKCDLTNIEKVIIAVSVAEIVLPIYEEKNSDKKRLKKKQ